MWSRLRPSISFVIGLAVLLPCMAGCGKSYQKYIPASDTARQALDTALAAWKDGRKLGRIEAFSPAVEVLDSRWLQGRTLRDYQILGEVHQDGPRCFTVQLLLDGPQQEEKVRYYVAGIEPLWVFRQEDYDMINHWACGEPEVKPARSPSNRR